jgi:uncharacterized protein
MLGTALRHSLDLRSLKILQLVRHGSSSLAELSWNPNAPEPIPDTKPLKGLTAAIHLSGANVAEHRWTADFKKQMVSSRVDSTHALATMLAGLRQPPKALLVASAIGIYGDRGGEILDERSNPGKGFLADLCKQWEAAAQPAVDAGIRVVHLRFGVVLARQGGALAKMLPIFRLGLGGPIASGRQWISWISLPDVVSAILFALDHTDLSGAVNLTAPAPVTNRDYTKALARAVHRPAILPAPAFALRLALGEMADEALLSSARAIPAKLQAAGFQFAHATIESAFAALLSGT